LKGRATIVRDRRSVQPRFFGLPPGRSSGLDFAFEAQMTRLNSRQLRALNRALLSLCEDVTDPQRFESISDLFETALPVSRISVKRKHDSEIVGILGVKVRAVGSFVRICLRKLGVETRATATVSRAQANSMHAARSLWQ